MLGDTILKELTEKAKEAPDGYYIPIGLGPEIFLVSMSKIHCYPAFPLDVDSIECYIKDACIEETLKLSEYQLQYDLRPEEYLSLYTFAIINGHILTLINGFYDLFRDKYLTTAKVCL